MACAALGLLVTWRPETILWWARKAWAPGLLWLGGANVKIEGSERVDAQRPAVFVANHQSAIDIPLLFRALPMNVRFMAKRSLLHVPLLGLFMWACGCVFIDRENRQKAIGSLQKAATRVREGMSIVAFAEGTRSRDGKVLPFKQGPFALAIDAQVPVYPLAVEGGGRLLAKDGWRIVPGPLKLKIGNPIETAGLSQSNRAELMNRVREEVVKMNRELGGEG